MKCGTVTLGNSVITITIITKSRLQRTNFYSFIWSQIKVYYKNLHGYNDAKAIMSRAPWSQRVCSNRVWVHFFLLGSRRVLNWYHTQKQVGKPCVLPFGKDNLFEEQSSKYCFLFFALVSLIMLFLRLCRRSLSLFESCVMFGFRKNADYVRQLVLIRTFIFFSSEVNPIKKKFVF